MMTAREIREKYLRFFESKGHAIVPSSSLVPENDPTTLFTGSGMQPMVPYLLGERHPLGTRIADSQKCFRSQDIEEVGDNRHTTFFEMLGNWSFGDYFKKEQIPWIWEFLTEELGLDSSRLYFTCFRGNEALGISRDDESALLWQELFREKGIVADIVDFPERDGMRGGRIFFYDEKKNWWSRSGVPGNMPQGEPGGPDTEMFWDFGEHLDLHEKSFWKDMPCHVNCDCGRFVEIGNNVFMEYMKTAGGFAKLPKPNVDFGGGLERLAAAVNDNPDVFRVDVLSSSLPFLEEYSLKKYGESQNVTRAFRIVMDHIRSSVFLFADGVVPSNVERGYFLRRLLRRAIRFSDDLGIPPYTISGLFLSFSESYENVYPDLKIKSVILNEINQEEEKFRQTLERGMRELEKRSFKKNISGADAFILFSTYGFPFELTQEIAAERGVSVDENAFTEEMKKHQDVSRAGSEQKFKGGLADHSEKTTKLHTATHLMLAGLRKYLGEGVHQAGSNITEERARFDFTYPEKVSRETLDKVEAYVNEAIRAECVVETDIMDKETARAAGVEASFWEKYPEKVTVYRVKSKDGTMYSEELCGGPHVSNTGGMGHFRIFKEEASSAGVRRVKAILE